jgi:hypothetical protein
VPPWRDVEVITGDAAITSAKVAEVVAPTESLTVSVKLAVPAADGTPLISPVPAVNPTPAGKDPPVTDQVNGPVPPPRATTEE